MDIKDLQREIIDAERLAERTRTILNANGQLTSAQGEITRLTAENERLAGEVLALSAHHAE